MSNYSQHFTLKELDCHCGCVTPPHIAKNLANLAQSLESLRTRLGGVPLHVNSGYRCPAYNARIGGAKESQHMSGKAADLSGKSVSPAKIAQHAELIPSFRNGGIGRYKFFTHVDIRDGAARWNG